MSWISITFREINKIVLLATIASLSFNLEKGSFSRNFIPSPFQILLVLSIVLTIIYVLKNHQIKDFFLSIPKKILIAVCCLYFSIFLGWIISILFLGIPTTIHTILDFGTFTMGMVLFFLVSFYGKDDKKYARWCLYSLFIPNIYLLIFFLTHGFVGYWGVPTDLSLDNVLDPNILSKTLLVPAMFFIGMSLYTLQNKNWQVLTRYIALASIFSMLVFWTVSRGALLSLVAGSIFVLAVLFFKEFSWKNLFLGGLIISFILLFGHLMLPKNTKQAINVKVANTTTLPVSNSENNSYIDKIINIPNITKSDIKKNSYIDIRYLIWYFYPKYIFQHPFGVGPNSSWDFNFKDKEGVHIYVGPDSTYLMVCLWGGLLGIISYLYILWRAFIGLWKKTFDSNSLILIGILFTLSVALFFDGIMSLYWFYIILALSFLDIGTLNKNEQ